MIDVCIALVSLGIVALVLGAGKVLFRLPLPAMMSVWVLPVGAALIIIGALLNLVGLC